jgi:hypothetical protein
MNANGIFQKLARRRGSLVLVRLLVVAGLFADNASAQPGSGIWTNHFSEPIASSSAWAMALDTNGNVFVTGYEDFGSVDYYATVAYSNSGQPLWTNLFGGGRLQPYDRASAICVASNGNVIVTGFAEYSTEDYATIAYSNSGMPLWTNLYNGHGLDDQATAIAVNSSNEVFVTGNSQRTAISPNDHDFATIKYSSSGIPLWTNIYNGPTNSDDHARAIAVSANGNVFVTGDSLGKSRGLGYVTIGYSGAGVPLWTNKFEAPGYANAVATDAGGNVFVTGGCVDSNNFPQWITIKYSNAGTPLWTNSFAGAQVKFGGYAEALAIATNGNIVVTGYTDDAVSSNTVFATVAYSNDGLPLWTNLCSGLSTTGSQANAVSLDAVGNVYVAGYSFTTNGQINYVTLAYSNTGLPLWMNSYDGTGNGIDSARAVAVDNNGNAIVTGYSLVDGAGYEYLTLKYAGVNAIGPMPLNFQVTGNQLILTWPNPAFSLQTKSRLDGIFTNLPGATSPYTNWMWGDQQYFRLQGSFGP